MMLTISIPMVKNNKAGIKNTFQQIVEDYPLQLST